MKKIIYSLVIMIAAGSLFTSCIEPLEPAGIYDLREAKARYYDALSKLRAADAIRVEADAELVRAQAEHERQVAANQALLNEMQKLINEAKAQDNAEALARWELEYEKLLAEQEKLRVEWATALAQAKEDWRQAMSKIEMAALDLTDAEKDALTEAIKRYEDAFEAYNTAKGDVLDAEAALWKAQYEIDNAYDEEGIIYDFHGDEIRTGVNIGEYYKSVEAYFDGLAALYALKMVDAESSDLGEWAKELEGLKVERDKVEYDRHKVTKDSVEYMMNIFHDGVHAYELAVAKWEEEHPAVTNPGSKPKDKDSTAFFADTITFPKLKVTNGQAFNKLKSLLSGYTLEDSPVSQVDPKHKVMYYEGDELIIVADQYMKEFILGDEKATDLEYKWIDTAKVEHTIAAQYGLYGMLSTLKRDLVLDKKAGKSEEELKTEAEAAYDVWKADRDSIIELYKAKPAKRAEAYKPLKDALDALAQAKEDAASESGSLVKASEKLIATLNGIITHDDMSSADSSELAKAFAEFAKARQDYLDYEPYKTEPPVDYDNKDYFYYPKSVTPSLLIDSIPFADITFEKIRSDAGKAYNYDITGVDWTATYPNIAAFYLIADQLLGNAVALKIAAMSATNPAIPDPQILNYDAFYGAYMYTPGTPAKIQTSGGLDYTPSSIGEAIADVAKAVDALNKLWDRFWKEDLGASADADGKVTIPDLNAKYNPETYELSSFTEPYNCVVFEGADIKWTANLGAVLGSVDPKKTVDDGSNFNTSGKVAGAAIFEGANGKTDFYNYMYALSLVGEEPSEEIKKIEQWIEDVVAAFEKDATDAADAAKKANKDAADKYDTDKKKYDEYAKEREKFTGVDTTKKNKPFYPIVKTIAVPVDYKSANVKQTEEEVYTWKGVWDLHGEQLKLAEKYLPGYPEKLAEWHTTSVQADHQSIHLNAIIEELEKAYLAALAYAEDEDLKEQLGNFTGTDVEKFFKTYVAYLQERSEYFLAQADAAADAAAQYEAGYDLKQIEIARLKRVLELAQAKLVDAQIKLDAAEAYYNAVLEKILGSN